MSLESEKYPEPFCPRAEPNFFRDLVKRVAEQKSTGLDILPKNETVTSQSGFATTGSVVWKREGFGGRNGLCISGDCAGAIVVYGPGNVIVGRMFFVDGGYFDGSVQKSLIRMYHFPEPLEQKLLTTVESREDGALAGILVMLLKELRYPVDAERFMANIRGTCLRYREKV